MLDYSSVTLAGGDLLPLIEDKETQAQIDQFLILAQPHVETALVRLLHEIIDDVNDAVGDHYRVRLVHEDCANFVEVTPRPDPAEGAAWAEIQEERREIGEAILPPGNDTMPKQPVLHDCMPAMADVIGGDTPSPVELPDGGQVDDKVKTTAGYVPWCDVAPAWRVLDLPRASAVCYVAPRGRDPQGELCQAIYAQVADLRQALGENGAAICAGGRLVVFNVDGTRAATFER